MTIRTSINAKALSGRLAMLETCTENAPRGAYEQAKLIRELLGETCDRFMRQLKRAGLKTPNCDSIREVGAALYGYVADANPLAVAAAEGFGVAMESPARERVIRQAADDRDFLAGVAGGDMTAAQRAVESTHGAMLATLEAAEAFIAGFEGDELQKGADELLADIRSGVAEARRPA